MIEPKATDETPKSPYDLWPDETERFDEMSEPRTIMTAASPDAEESTMSEPKTRANGAFPDALEASEPATHSIFSDNIQPPFADPFAPQPYGEPESKFDAPFEAPFIPVAYTPETMEQSVRSSGLAWSAGVVFFGSVVFMMFLGWLADLLLGSSPYGLVIGIVLGSIIGFVQFFRISSQIFSTKKPDPDHRPLLTRDEPESPL